MNYFSVTWYQNRLWTQNTWGLQIFRVSNEWLVILPLLNPSASVPHALPSSTDHLHTALHGMICLSSPLPLVRASLHLPLLFHLYMSYSIHLMVMACKSYWQGIPNGKLCSLVLYMLSTVTNPSNHERSPKALQLHSKSSSLKFIQVSLTLEVFSQDNLRNLFGMYTIISPSPLYLMYFLVLFFLDVGAKLVQQL